MDFCIRVSFLPEHDTVPLERCTLRFKMRPNLCDTDDVVQQFVLRLEAPFAVDYLREIRSGEIVYPHEVVAKCKPKRIICGAKAKGDKARLGRERRGEARETCSAVVERSLSPKTQDEVFSLCD